MYYVSKVLTKTKMNYIEVEKYLDALVSSDRKIHPYFHEKQLKHFLQKLDAFGRIIK